MDLSLRNLKDFLTLYNKLTELCFNRCVDNLNGRELSKHEDTCVTNCANKFVRFNQQMMSVYVQVQTQLNQKRLKELEEHQKLLEQQPQQEQQQQQESKTSVNAPAAGTAQYMSPSFQSKANLLT